MVGGGGISTLNNGILAAIFIVLTGGSPYRAQPLGDHSQHTKANLKFTGL